MQFQYDYQINEIQFQLNHRFLFSLKNQMRQIVSLHIGQAGIQIGSACWETYANQHQINEQGFLRQNKKLQNNEVVNQTMFEQTKAGRYVPRCFMVDLQPMAMDEVKKGKYSKMFNPNGFYSGKQSSANNFVRAHFTLGKQNMQMWYDKIHRIIQRCDNMQGLMIYQSVEGGTGSGLGSLILSRLSTDYPKVVKMQHMVVPSPQICTNMVSPYNANLAFHQSLSNADITLLYDNQALYKLAEQKQQIQNPSYGNINKLIAQTSSNITISHRFPKDNVLSCNLNQLCTNLIPYRRTKFLTVSCSTLNGFERQFQKQKPIEALTRQLFLNNNSYLSMKGDVGLNMGSAIFYRGNAILKDINQTINTIRDDKNICNNSFVLTGFKFVVNTKTSSQGYSVSNNSKLPISCSMVANNSKVSELFSRINLKYDKLYHYRAFVHWYVGEGLDQGFFSQSRQDLAALQKDYQEINNFEANLLSE